jgi:hypothetical protein
MADFPAAVCDLERVVTKDPKYDFYHAPTSSLMLTRKPGSRKKRQLSPDRADFNFVGTYLNYANFLADQGAHCRGPRVDPAHPCQEANPARIFETAGTSLVPQSQ